jgi:hypothetical protein
MHNITSNLCAQLSYYKTFSTALKAVNSFFCHRWQLDVWLAACLLGSEHAANKNRLQQLKVTMLDSRWGTVIKFLELLLAIEDIVRERWDIRAICLSQGWPLVEAAQVAGA